MSQNRDRCIKSKHSNEDGAPVVLVNESGGKGCVFLGRGGKRREGVEGILSEIFRFQEKI